MDTPATPPKQVQAPKLTPPTPPPTATINRAVTGINNDGRHSPDLPIRPLTYDTPAAIEAGGGHGNLGHTLCVDSTNQQHNTQLPDSATEEQYSEDEEAEFQLKWQHFSGESEPEWDASPPSQDEVAVTHEPDGKQQRSDTHNRTESDITRWVSSSTTRDQSRQRFTAFLHSLWPSNAEFNADRLPSYNSERDGPYEEFARYEMWNGNYPYDDYDYDPGTNPKNSTEVWQPKIGDEGIEDEHDLRMVLKAREEHRARSAAFKKRKDRAIKAQLRAGVKYADINIAQVLLRPDIKLNESNSKNEFDFNCSKQEDEIEPEATDKMETPPAITDAPSPCNPTQPMVTVKRIRVIGANPPSNDHGQRKGSKKRIKKKQNTPKRKREGGENPNDAYVDDGGSEDEPPTHQERKRAKGSAAQDGRLQRSTGTDREIARGLGLADDRLGC
ncbi:hypothetical protein NUW58_g6819 [Xylaria curta]|uniref:Uncharacterized protein n=1 Tax=Xylaria curta TaxID=42375 RepID=A0ACC1NR84_9PEZI|nr:hypothetical protein NUW58_g6819 [Xylaria curta]